MEESMINLLYLLIGAIISGFIAYHFFQEKIKFFRLHEERAKIIKEFYEKLVIFEDSMKYLTSPMKFYGDIKEREKLKISEKNRREFEIYYLKNKIYLSKKICDIIEEILKEMRHSWITFLVYTDEIDEQKINEPKEKWDERVKAWKKIVDEVPLLKNNLEREFKKILGVKK